jgi:hypothetical protein
MVPVVDAILDATSATAYYFVSDMIDTVEYAFLEGENGLQTFTRQGFSIDGVEVKLRLVFGAGALDWRGMVFNNGA